MNRDWLNRGRSNKSNNCDSPAPNVGGSMTRSVAF